MFYISTSLLILIKNIGFYNTRIFKLIIFLFKKDGFKTSRFSFNVKIRHYKTFQKTNY